MTSAFEGRSVTTSATGMPPSSSASRRVPLPDASTAMRTRTNLLGAWRPGSRPHPSLVWGGALAFRRSYTPTPGGGTVDLSKLTTSDKMILGGALAYLIFMFFPWYGIEAFGVSYNNSGWDYFLGGILPLILI